MSDRFLLVLWLTSRCNLQCSYCYASAGPQGRDMDFETARKAIEGFHGRPLKIQFAGGEPTLNFFLVEKICRYAKKQNLDAVFQLQTNGTLLTENMVRKMKEYRISVGVSLDGIPEINGLTRGKTREAVRGIQLLKQEGMTIGINAVVTARNVAALPKLVDFAFYLQNVGGIGLDLLRHAGRGTTEEYPSPEALRQALTGMYHRREELKKRFGVHIELREIALAERRLRGMGDRHHYCYASLGRSAVVLPDGRLYPCGSLISDDYCMGSCENMNPDGFLRLKTDDNSSHCLSCSYGEICPRGCPSRQIKNGNDLECVLLKTAFSLAERHINEDRN